MTIVVVSALLSGCAGDPDDPIAEAGANDEGDAEQTQPTEDPNGDGASGDLDAVVLSVEDLPEGWTEVAEEGDEAGSCLDRLTDPGGPFAPSESVHRSFAASDLGPFLVAVATPSPADDVLVAVDEVLISCDGHTTEAGFTSSLEAVAIPDLPWDALSVRGTEEHEEGGSVDFVVAGAGTGQATVLVLGVTALGDIEDGLVAHAVTTMVERLP